MALSGSTNLTTTRDGIITEALELLGVIPGGGTISANDLTTCATTLNTLVKFWATQGIGLWKNKEVALFQGYEEYKYTIGFGGDHATTDYTKTEVATAGVAADTTITIDSITGINDSYDRDGIITAVTPIALGAITLDGALVSSSVAYLNSTRNILIYSDGDDSGVTFTIVGVDALGVAVTEVITGPDTTIVFSTKKYKNITSVTISGAGTGNIEVGCVGDNIGIELDSGAMQWTFINGATSTTMPLLDTLTSAAAVDNHVYCYSAKVSKPMFLENHRIQSATGNETPLNDLMRDEYMILTDKTSKGTPNSIYYDRGLNTGDIYIWPSCSNVQKIIKFTARLQFEDFDFATNTADFPMEWFLPLAYNLAVMVAPKFEADIPPIVLAIAQSSFEEAKDFDREYGSIKFGVSSC